jgi:predicted peroxiredoxin
MKLGIHIKTDRHLEQVVGIVNAAAAKGHEVTIFVMSGGERLLENPKFSGLCKTPNIVMSYCDHDATHMGIRKEMIPAEIASGSQFNNAVMVDKADRVIVL